MGRRFNHDQAVDYLFERIKAKPRYDFVAKEVPLPRLNHPYELVGQADVLAARINPRNPFEVFYTVYEAKTGARASKNYQTSCRQRGSWHARFERRDFTNYTMRFVHVDTTNTAIERIRP